MVMYSDPSTGKQERDITLTWTVAALAAFRSAGVGFGFPHGMVGWGFLRQAAEYILFSASIDRYVSVGLFGNCNGASRAWSRV